MRLPILSERDLQHYNIIIRISVSTCTVGNVLVANNDYGGKPPPDFYGSKFNVWIVLSHVS